MTKRADEYFTWKSWAKCCGDDPIDHIIYIRDIKKYFILTASGYVPYDEGVYEEKDK